MNKKNIILGLSMILSSTATLNLASCNDDNDGDDNYYTQEKSCIGKKSHNVATMVNGTIEGHDYVNLGLPSRTLWATCNLGATSPHEMGSLYQWGMTTSLNYAIVTEVDQKKYGDGIVVSTTEKVYKSNFWTHTMRTRTKNKTISLYSLNSADDAAYVNWGSKWSMPTRAQLEELRNGCTWQYTDNYKETGVKGLIGTSKTTANTIFLPCAQGDTHYISSELSDDTNVWCFDVKDFTAVTKTQRYAIYPIRAVTHF